MTTHRWEQAGALKTLEELQKPSRLAFLSIVRELAVVAVVLPRGVVIG